MLKVNKQTESEMILKESSVLHIVIGLVFAAFGGVMLFMPEVFQDNAPDWWIGALFLAVGLGVILFVKGSTVVHIDKAGKKLTLKHAGIILKDSTDYNLGEVEEVELRKYYSTMRTSKGGRQTKMNIETSIILTNDRRVTLSRTSGSGLVTMFQSGSGEKALAQNIAKFIGVEFKDRKPPTAEEVLGAISKGIEKGIKGMQKDE